MVQSVAAVSGVSKVRRDRRDISYPGTKERESNDNFAQVLEEAKISLLMDGIARCAPSSTSPVNTANRAGG